MDKSIGTVKKAKVMGNHLKNLIQTIFNNSIEIVYSSVQRQAWTSFHPPPLLKDKYNGTHKRLKIFHRRTSPDYED